MWQFTLFLEKREAIFNGKRRIRLVDVKSSDALILGKFITLWKLHFTYIRKKRRSHKYKAYPAPATE